MKKILSIFLVLFIPFFVLCGCGDKHFEGEICHLEYKEEYSEEITKTTFVWTGKFGVPIYTDYIRTYPDRWYVEVRSFNKEKQKYEYNDCYVTKECFEKLKIGDWFVYDESYCFSKEPYTEVRK